MAPKRTLQSKPAPISALQTVGNSNASTSQSNNSQQPEKLQRFLSNDSIEDHNNIETNSVDTSDLSSRSISSLNSRTSVSTTSSSLVNNKPPKFSKFPRTSVTEDGSILLEESVEFQELNIGVKSLMRLRKCGYCKRHYQQMKHPKYTIMTLNRGLTATYCIDEHYEILVRVLLRLFGQDPEDYALHNKTFQMACQPGYMYVPNESLLSNEMCEIMSRNKSVSRIYFSIIIVIIPLNLLDPNNPK